MGAPRACRAASSRSRHGTGLRLIDAGNSSPGREAGVEQPGSAALALVACVASPDVLDELMEQVAELEGERGLKSR